MFYVQITVNCVVMVMMSNSVVGEHGTVLDVQLVIIVYQMIMNVYPIRVIVIVKLVIVDVMVISWINAIGAHGIILAVH
jgi:hypothetical protein